MNQMTDDVRHLLVSFPEDANDGEPWAILDGLLMRTMVDLLDGASSTGLLGQEQVTRRINEVTGLSFDSGEVQEALERLEKAGKLAFVDRGKKSITIDPHAAQREKRQVGKRIDLEQRARDIWLEGFMERNPGVDDAFGEKLWHDLRGALGRLVNTRSAEAAAFLYVDQQEGRTRFEEILNDVRALSEICEGPEYVPTELFQSEFARMILAPKGPQADFLLAVLTAAFQYHLVCLDPAAARLARSVVGSKVFYLDTNFLFRLLALHGPREAHGPALIAELASELSTELRVARATLHEFKSAVRYHSKGLRPTILQRQDFRRIAVDHVGTDLNFMTEFYRQQQSGLVGGVDEFTSKYLQIERALEDWGITVDEQCTWSDDVLAGLTERSSRLMSWSSGTKSQPSCDHDVLMEHYVREARKTQLGGLNDVDVWFLTYDRRLTRFAFGNPIDGELPAPLLAEDWLQIVRRFSPRTEEYDRAFLGLLSSPLLVDDQAVPYTHLVKALSRLESYQGLSAKVVAGMVVEREFVKRMNEPLDPAEEKQLVELTVAKVTSRIEEQLEQARARAKRAELDRDQALRERDESTSTLDRWAQEREEAARDAVIPTMEAELQAARAHLKQAELDRDQALRERNESASALDSGGRKVVALRVGVTVLFAALLAVTVDWLWAPALLGGPMKWRVFLVLSAVAVQALATGLVWGWKRLGWVASILALTLALFQFLLEGA